MKRVKLYGLVLVMVLCVAVISSCANAGSDANMEERDFYTIQGDVTGNGKIDTISLIGDSIDGTVYNNVYISIKEEQSGKIIDITPWSDCSSKRFELFLGDFDGDDILDIWFQDYRFGSYSSVESIIYSIKDDQAKILFDSDIYNNMFTSSVKFENDYDVHATFNETEKNGKAYIFDFSCKGSYFGSSKKLYDENGNLNNSMLPENWDERGAVGAITDLRPIFLGNGTYSSGVYGMSIKQSITGFGAGEVVGKFCTILVFDKDNQSVVLYHENEPSIEVSPSLYY